MKIDYSKQNKLKQMCAVYWSIISYIFCLISGVHLVTRATPSCLMGNVFLTVSITFLKSSFQGMKSAEAAPGLFYLLHSSVLYEHEEVLSLCNDYHRFFFSPG